VDYGKQLKEEGQALALEHAGRPWAEQAVELLTVFCFSGPGRKRPFALEDFRMWALAQGLPEPASPNAWGALPRIGIRDNLMRATGQYRAARSPLTHAHPVMTYTACAPEIS